jgi:glycosyltransferase involved in cell wall biosynthesis
MGEIRFVPYETDQARLAMFYRAADLYLHAARADNLPTTILEALGSGLPVIATAVGGIAEEVRSLVGAPGAWRGESHPASEATGVLVREGDSDGMAAAATAVLADAELRELLGTNAARDAAGRFNLEQQLDSTIAWYREVIADWRDRAAGGATIARTR